MSQNKKPTYTKYRRTQIAEMADWIFGFDMTDVSVSVADQKAGSPKVGDKIARNPVNPEDRWLVAADYFAQNFEAVAAPEVPGSEYDKARLDWLEKPGSYPELDRAATRISRARMGKEMLPIFTWREAFDEAMNPGAIVPVEKGKVTQ